MENSSNDSILDSDVVAENLFESVPQAVIKELVVCPLLPHILTDPVCCSSCEAHFCRSCLQRAMRRDPRCPLCRQDIEEPGPSQKFMKRILEHLSLICINMERGCPEKIKYDVFLEHISNCPYEELKCSNYLCGKAVLKKDFPSHKKACDEERLPCEYCSNEFFRNDLLFHANKRVCADACKHCKKIILRKDLPSHEPHCDSILVICLFCQGTFFKANIESHQLQCTFRKSFGMTILPGMGQGILMPNVPTNFPPPDAYRGYPFTAAGGPQQRGQAVQAPGFSSNQNQMRAMPFDRIPVPQPDPINVPNTGFINGPSHLRNAPAFPPGPSSYVNASQNNLRGANSNGYAQFQNYQGQAAPMQSNQMQGNRMQSNQLQGNQLQANQMQSSPMQSSPMQSSTLQSSPLQSSPMQSSPMQTSPMQTSPMQSPFIGHSKPNYNLNQQMVQTGQPQPPMRMGEMQRTPVRPQEMNGPEIQGVIIRR